MVGISIRKDLFQQSNTTSDQYGFTLIELMITVAILAILASIAIPNYQSYLIKNREAELQNKLLSLSIELEQWRAKALSYSGFVPKSGYAATAGTVNYPTTDPQYIITIGQLIDNSGSVSVVPLNDGQVRGNSWVMMAAPKESNSDKRYFKLNSQGLRCVNNVAFDITDAGCGAGQLSW